MSTVLITGAGGAAIPALVDSLRRDGHRVLAADMDPNAGGLYLADAGFVIPGGAARDFALRLDALCRAEGVEVLIPLVDEELVAAAGLERPGLAVLAPRPAFAALALDKFELMGALARQDVAVPETRLASEGASAFPLPAVVKPRTGRGSRGVSVVWTAAELAGAVAGSGLAPERILLQRFVDGPEFTVSVVAWRDGSVQAVVPKEVIVKRGITRLAVARRHAAIDALGRRVQQALRADGPFNIQLRLDPATGIPLPFEINPRYSTTVSLTQAAGVDEVGMLVRQATGARPGPPPAWREGVTLVRVFSDRFIDEAELRRRAPRACP